MTLLTMMLLPFLMSEHTSFLSSNAIAAMFNCAIKVCVIAFLAAAGSSALGGFFDSIKGDFASKGKSLLGIFIQLNMTVGFFLFMVLKIPKLVQGLLSGGSPQMGASDAMGMARQGAHMTANAISGGATTALKAAGAYAAAGGGGSKMSSISNIGGGGSDATGMGAISGLSGGGGGGGAAAMAANMGGGSGGGAASGASSGGGSKPMPSSGSEPLDGPADTGAKGGTGQSTFGRFKRAVATAGKNAVISAAQSNGLVQAFQKGYKTGSNPYGLSDTDTNAGGVRRSLASGEVLNAAGNKVDYNLQNKIEYPEIKSSVTNPPPKLPQFDPNNFQV